MSFSSTYLITGELGHHVVVVEPDGNGYLDQVCDQVVVEVVALVEHHANRHGLDLGMERRMLSAKRRCITLSPTNEACSSFWNLPT